MSKQTSATNVSDSAAQSPVIALAHTPSVTPKRRSSPSVTPIKVAINAAYSAIDNVLVPEGYQCRPDGVYFTGGEAPFRLTTRRVWISGLLRGFKGNAWSFILNYEDADGIIKDIVLSFQILSRPDALYELAGEGLVIFPGAVKELARYLTLQTDEPDMPRVRLQRTLGFFRVPCEGQSDAWGFMMPTRCIWPRLAASGNAEVATPIIPEEVRFCPERDSRVHEAYRPSDTLENWQDVMRPVGADRKLTQL